MRSSKFNDDMKRSILLERLQGGLTVQQLCKKYNISVNTYYLWKRDLEGEGDLQENQELKLPPVSDSVQTENKILRRLYINLSAHNYELAKFLDK